MKIADGMRNTTEDIIASHKVRTKALGDLVTEVSASIKNDATNRKAMSAEQAAELARFTGGLAKSISAKLEQMGKDRALSAKKLKSRLQKESEDLEKMVNKTLADYHKDHADMSGALRHNLQSFVKDLRTETRGMMREYRQEMREAGSIWSNMTRTLSAVGIKGEVAPRTHRRKKSKK